MEPTLTWLDLTAGDRDKMRRVLDLFSEQGTVDEMGLGGLRDMLSDELFPGATSLHTRLRYVLFIPWLYQQLEARGASGNDIAQAARAAEIALIDPLCQNEDDEGVIGAVSRSTLTYLPSSIYWAALSRWKIFAHSQSQSWYHLHFDSLTDKRKEVGRADDPGIMWEKQPNWHPRLPPPPDDFPENASFFLTFEEADFLQGRLEEKCTGSLFAWLAGRESFEASPNLWDNPEVSSATPKIRDTVELARRFSLHVEGAPLLYNLLLAERRDELHGDDDSLIENYRDLLSKWSLTEQQEEAFEPDLLWQLVARRGGHLSNLQRRFVETWSKRVAQIGPAAVADDAPLRSLISQREMQLKGGRARLVNEGRLLDWSGRGGIGRMNFRWFRVRQLLIDLHRGLAA